MSRRKSAGDQEFGSDSFLDIIANIVGILIILIVIAGIKVARQPDPAHHPVPLVSTAEAIESQPDMIGDDPETVLAPKVPASVAEAIDHLVEPTTTDFDVPEVDPEAELQDLIAEVDLLQMELQGVVSTTASSEAELKELLAELTRTDVQKREVTALTKEAVQVQQTIRSLSESIAQTRVRTAAFESTLGKMHQRQQYVVKALQQVGVESRRLREVIEKADENTPDTDRLQHRLSPVGRRVDGKELMFRMCNGHIAQVPVEQLMTLMSRHWSRQRAPFRNSYGFTGRVGPVGGFILDYTVQRQLAPVLQRLQAGRSPFTVIPSFSIRPSDTLRAEPIDDALKFGSRFRQIVEGADLDTTVTVFVYPADFRHFGAIRELTHALNLRVAARPLVDGDHIRGGPHGSASSGQ